MTDTTARDADRRWIATQLGAIGGDGIRVIRRIVERFERAQGRRINILGSVFGRLTVIDVAPDAPDGHQRWKCRCVCGGQKDVITGNLRRGRTLSCGCLHAERTSAAKTVHGHHRGGASRTYSSWRSMIHRCVDERANAWENYGGRGIEVCERWLHSFVHFLADLGERPANTTLDRIDVNGNYEPNNCRWATPHEQAYNKRTSVLEAHEPEQIRWLISLGYKHRDIAKHFGVKQGTIAFLNRRRRNA